MDKSFLSHEITIKEIVEKTNGKLILGDEKRSFSKFTNDTRKIEGGEIYIGLMGEKTNGGIFFENAFEKGAEGAIVQNIEFTEEQKQKYKDKIIILVDDTLEALQTIAKIKRESYKDLKVVAITGSVGKTSTKDMIANVLSQKYNTLKTEGNFNNHIGLPLTLLRLQDEEVAVVEMGMNHFGEIRVLTNIAKPNLCVMTNIGTSHIGNLGSRENILKSKLEILEGNEEKEIVINNDNDLLHKFYEENKENNDIEVISYGIEEKSKVYATQIVERQESTTFNCHINDDIFEINVPVAGMHFVYNALCAATVGNKLGLSNEEIKRGIETFELTKKRMDITNTRSGIKIINDAYNASFESMKGAIENLSKYKENRKIAVLGDMFELGDYTEELHKKVGEEVAKNNIDILICMGDNSINIVETAKENGMDESKILYFTNREELILKLKETLKTNDVVLFKASNGMKFFEIAETLKEEI